MVNICPHSQLIKITADLQGPTNIIYCVITLDEADEERHHSTSKNYIFNKTYLSEWSGAL